MPYLLDILGNENRRNILTLLSYRPCYVTEISEELGVARRPSSTTLRYSRRRAWW